MSRLEMNPPRERLNRWGALAYVSDEERRKIMDGGYGDFAKQKKILEREIAEAKKKLKKR